MLAPPRRTASTTFTRCSTSISEPAMYLRATQSGMSAAASSLSQPLANSVIDSPSPPAQSPTTRRVKPTLGCSARHASTSLSRAALLTAYAPSPGHGGVSDALTDDRYIAVPCDALRWGIAAAVTSAAPVTFVSKVRRQVSASV